MQQLTSFPLPLKLDAPPTGYAGSECMLSDSLTTTAFNTCLDARDTFFGTPSCVICGVPNPLQHCHVIPKSERETWTDLKDRKWLPEKAKSQPDHEPRNGLVLCANHHLLFDGYLFFIRFFPNIKRFVLVNYSDQYNELLQPYHGKAIALDIADKYAPFPSSFIIHEMRVRGFRPFHNPHPEVPADDAVQWENWITTRGVWDDARSQFHRHRPHGSGAPRLPQMPSMTPMDASGSGGEPSASGMQRLELNNKVIADILAATREMRSWKECEIEGTSWTGTAEENRQKYLAISQDS